MGLPNSFLKRVTRYESHSVFLITNEPSTADALLGPTWLDILSLFTAIILSDSTSKGTGIGSTITAKTLSQLGGPKEQAAYLKLFRADSIGKSTAAWRLCTELGLTLAETLSSSRLRSSS